MPIHYKVREEDTAVKKAVYIAVGTDLEDKKDVLGPWLGATEGSKYWLGMLNGLKNRGVQEILIISVDGLTGFSEPICAAYLRMPAMCYGSLILGDRAKSVHATGTGGLYFKQERYIILNIYSSNYVK